MGASAVKAGEAFIEIGGRDKKLGEALARSQKRLKAFGEKVKSLGKTFVKLGALAVASIAVISFVKATKAASEFEETLSKFNAVFKEQSEVTRQWASDFSLRVGRAEDQIIGFLSTMQDTFVPLGFARDRAAALSKQVTQLAIDLASFNNESEPDTIRSLQSALVGNTETVRKYGVIITQVTLGQELLTLGLASSVTEATEQQKVMARLSIIMKSTTDAQGDAERTSGSFANRMRALNATFRDLAVTVGEVLLPRLTKLVNTIIGATTKFTEWLKEGKKLEKLFLSLESIWASFGEPFINSIALIVRGLGKFSSLLRDIVSGLFDLEQSGGGEPDEIFGRRIIGIAEAGRIRNAQIQKEKEAAAAKNKVDEEAAIEIVKKKAALASKAAKKGSKERAVAEEKLQEEILFIKIDFAERSARIEEMAREQFAKKELDEAERRSRIRGERGRALQGIIGEAGGEKPREVSGGFGAFASRLLALQVPRGLQDIGERQLEVQNRMAEGIENIREDFQRLALIVDPSLLRESLALSGKAQNRLFERLERQADEREAVRREFQGDPSGLAKFLEILIKLQEENNARQQRIDQRLQEELFGLGG